MNTTLGNLVPLRRLALMRLVVVLLATVASILAVGVTLRQQRVGVLRPVREADVEQRALSDYDAALGISVELQLDAHGGVAGEVAG
jgi:hypothetical protein